jgi:hypothetical protein
MDLGEVLPWGLTVGQTLCLGVGGVLLLGGWGIVTSALRLSKNMFLCGLVGIMMLACCAATMLAAYQLVR